LFSSVDSYANPIDDISGLRGAVAGVHEIDITDPAFQGLTAPVTFRLTISADAATDFRGVGVDDLTLNGSVIPEPGTMGLLVLAFGLMGLWKRRQTG